MNTTKLFYFTAIHLVVLLLLHTSGYAQSGGELSDCVASPYPITIKQANGTSLTIVGRGTMNHSWTETSDGYSVVNKEGVYEYAIKQNGKLIPSGKAARNPLDRKSGDQQFLQQIPKSLMPDASLTGEKSMRESLPIQAAAFPNTGNKKALLLLIKFPNLPNDYSKSNFENLMNQASYQGTGSFKDYMTASSFGKLNVSTDVYGWYTAKNNYSYYGKQYGNERGAVLVREAVDAAEAAGIDFSKYDNDGDGVVDGIIVAHAGLGAEEGAQLQYIWSHASSLGNAGKAVTYDGVKINRYIINPEKRQFTGAMVGIGVFCHEFGHLLGLPDLYDTDKSNGASNGTGNWSLMATAGWLADEYAPGNMCAWSKSKLGWITPTVITSGSYYLLPASKFTDCYRINTSVPNEYFLVENRKQTGLDAALPGAGMAIWHINTTKTSMYPPVNEVNADENLKGVDLEEADGYNDLDNNKYNEGDNGDLFPGRFNKHTFSDATAPSAKLYTGANSGILIKHIMQDVGGNIWFTLGNPSPSITGVNPTIETVGSEITITGNNLSEATGVKFNNTISVPFTVVNPTKIKTTVPPGAKSGKITVEFPSVTRYTTYFTVSSYCIPSYTYACSSGFINKFTLNTLVNSNSGCSGETNNYKNYAPEGAYTTTVRTGKTYYFTVQLGGAQAQGVGIWIDFNNDKDFDDAGEFLYNHVPMTGSVTSQIVIPANATTGLRRMRVRSKQGAEFTAAQACQDVLSGSGETEDYTIAIGYDIPNYAHNCNYYHIDDVSFNTLQNLNSNCNGNANNYMLYPETGNFTTVVNRGAAYTLTVKSGNGATAFGVWIDYNNDQDFADNGEFILQTSVDNAATSYTFTIPFTISDGKKRLRVRSKAPGTVSSQEYWNDFEYGETEDYTITVMSPLVQTTLRINCGGPQITAGGNTYMADTYFSSPSETYANANTGDIANTTNDVMYQDYRRAATDGGSFAYNIPVINGQYEVRLNFAEIYNSTAGSRVFSVNLEGGSTELANFDIFAAAGGKNKAITKTYTITVEDGMLNIAFSSTTGKALISAITIIPLKTARLAAASGSAEENVPLSNLTVYPVPAADLVHIAFTSTTNDFMTVDIFDAQGMAIRKLYEGKAEMDKQYSFTIDGQELTPGIYFVKIASPAGTETKKLVIIR